MSTPPAPPMQCHFCARPVREFVRLHWRRPPVRRRTRSPIRHRPANPMPIHDELKAQILRYHFVEHWRVGTIARQLGIHHSTVERVLGAAGVERARQRPRRPSKLDPYVEFITETLERFPTLTAARLFEMVQARGYPGGLTHPRKADSSICC